MCVCVFYFLLFLLWPLRSSQTIVGALLFLVSMPTILSELRDFRKSWIISELWFPVMRPLLPLWSTLWFVRSTHVHFNIQSVHVDIFLLIHYITQCNFFIWILQMFIFIFTLQHSDYYFLPKQRYNQVNENFLKSDHPAVARTKPRLSSPFPIANPSFGSPTLPSALTSSPLSPPHRGQRPGEPRQESHTQEVMNSFNEYIIPIPDPKPEEVFTDVPESPVRYGNKWVVQIWTLHQSWMWTCLTRAAFPHHTPTHPDVELKLWLYYVGGNSDVFL